MPRPLSLLLRLLFLGLTVGTVGLCAGFELTGELPAAFNGAVATVHRESVEQRNSTQLTSSPVADGRLRLQVESEAGLFTLRLRENEVSFVATDGQALRISAGEEGAALRVEGARDQTLYAEYERFRTASLARLVYPVREAMRAARVTGSDADVERLTNAEVNASRAHRRELNDFTLEKLRGSPALYAASLRWDGDYRLDELAEAVREFSERHGDLEIARLLKERIARFRATAIGAVAPALEGRAPDGSIISLAQLRGRHVLVDFWAAWCAPCRIENRNYAKLYPRYRDAGFEILAVSVDQNESAWKTAIAQDRAIWLHISDLSGWRSPLAGSYNVSALPASFLLDPEGRIVAKDLPSAELAATLAARLKRAESSTTSKASP